MRISKEAEVFSEIDTGNGDIEKINRFSRRELTEDEVFTFSVVLCDNEIDRDGECFPLESLCALAELFVGKTGITDHNWTASGQIARIYDAELVTDAGRLTSYGEEYACVRAKAYTLRTAGNEELIAQIQGGIKKEVSVGCAVTDRICSICGQPIGSDGCGHIKGAEYGGKKCYAILTEPTDAYEWSFVAVPAQRGAGVSKRFPEKQAESLKELVDMYGTGGMSGRLEELERLAEIGRRCISDARKDVVRLGMLTKLWDGESLAKAAEKLDGSELLSLREALEKKADELLPPETQLRGVKQNDQYAPETEYMV